MLETLIKPEVIADSPMPFAEHLGELRRRLIAIVVILSVGTLIVFQFSAQILSWLARPVGQMVFLSPLEAFHTRLEIAVVGALVLTLPLLLHQVWLFVAPALNATLRRTVLKMLPLSYVLFIMGCSLCLFIVLPATVKFLLAFGTDRVRPMMTLGAYMGFVTRLTLAFGGVFQLPLVLYGFNQAGLLERSTLAGYRKGVYFLCFVGGAFLSPDVFAQFCIAIPAIVLFEITLLAMGR